MVEIRPYQEGDLEALYRICLATGEAGADATHLYDDPRLLGHVFAAPYGVLSPQTCFVAEDEEGVGAYILGTLDTRAFEAEQEAQWWPALRDRYADPGPKPQAHWRRDDMLASAIHHPGRTPSRIAGPFPSHLHIDLLPRLQGRGFGRQMLDIWFAHMRAMGSPGAHLGVSAANTRAIRFYRAYGLDEPEAMPSGGLWFACTL